MLPSICEVELTDHVIVSWGSMVFEAALIDDARAVIGAFVHLTGGGLQKGHLLWGSESTDKLLVHRHY